MTGSEVPAHPNAPQNTPPTYPSPAGFVLVTTQTPRCRLAPSPHRVVSCSYIIVKTFSQSTSRWGAECSPASLPPCLPLPVGLMGLRSWEPWNSEKFLTTKK